MTPKDDRSFTGILAGVNPRINDRDDLRAAFDDLLDAAEADGGQMDPSAFWGFVAALAAGRGIAEDLQTAAAMHIASSEAPLGGGDDLWKRWQWALLSALVSRVSQYQREVLPEGFSASAFRAVADNIVSNPAGGEAPDLLGTESQRGSWGQALRRACRRTLVLAVYYEAAKNGGSYQAIGKARLNLLGESVPTDTFKGWVKETLKARRTDRGTLMAELKGKTPLDAAVEGLILTPDEIQRRLRLAHWRTR